MMHLTELWRAIRIHLYNMRKPTPHKRFTMSVIEYENFTDATDRDIYIQRMLTSHGFDLGKDIDQYRGMNNPNILFEQL